MREGEIDGSFRGKKEGGMMRVRNRSLDSAKSKHLASHHTASMCSMSKGRMGDREESGHMATDLPSEEVRPS